MPDAQTFNPYFNEAERLDPRNVVLLSQHAFSYIELRRFPGALRKLDQVLNIIPDDLDTLAAKAGIAQAEGDLPRAAALLAPLHPGADESTALETQVYQAILERRPAAMITRLEEVLAKPDPALGYVNDELRFYLGWAQEVAGDHAAAQESWRRARSELEFSLKDLPENNFLMGDLALTDAGLGDKAAAFALSKRFGNVTSALRFFEIARVLVRLSQVASRIVNANYSRGFRFASIRRLVDVSSFCDRRIRQSRFVSNRF